MDLWYRSRKDPGIQLTQSREVSVTSFKKLALYLVVALFVAIPSQAQQQESGQAASAQELQQLRDLVQKLQARVDRLESEKAASQQTVTATVTASGSGAATAIVATTEQKPAPGPFDGLVDVLGGATLTGFVDTYYNVNFSQPVVPATSLTSTGGHVSGLRSWDGQNNNFTLSMAQVALDKPPDASKSRIGYHLALMFGSGMYTLNNSEPNNPRHNLIGYGWDQYLMEAYMSYLAPVGKGLQFDVGKFVTPIGAEVVPNKDNWNYTRGLLYDFAIPIYHFGIRAKYTFNDKVNLTGFVLNGWNNTIDNNSGKTVAASLVWTPNKKLTITQNYMAGPEQDDTSVFALTQPLPFTPLVSPNADRHWRQLVDTTVLDNVTPKLSLQVNFDYGRGDRVPGIPNPVYWTGVAGYARYALAPRDPFTVRYEYYNDHYGFTTGTAQHLNEVTATFEHRFGGHMISRFEYRRDMSNRPVFFDHSVGLVNGITTLKNQNTATAGLILVLQKIE